MIVLRAGWVVPVEGPPLRDGAVAVKDGRVTWIGPASDAPAGVDVATANEPIDELRGLAFSRSVPLPASEAEPDVIPAAADGATAGMVAPMDGVCPASHPIKGNHSSGGEYIYHLPDGQLYARTNPEACFATAADAEAAGYRRSKR